MTVSSQRAGVAPAYVTWAGHIGYGIRPSARRRGLASWALGRLLEEARAVGLDRAMLVCAVDNLASAKTIEHCGGVLESITGSKVGPVRRYWINLDRSAPGDAGPALHVL